MAVASGAAGGSRARWSDTPNHSGLAPPSAAYSRRATKSPQIPPPLQIRPPRVQLVWILRSGALLFANPADGGVGFANSRIQGTVRKSTDMGKTWQQSALHITPLGLSAARGGSYDYRCVS